MNRPADPIIPYFFSPFFVYTRVVIGSIIYFSKIGLRNSEKGSFSNKK